VVFECVTTFWLPNKFSCKWFGCVGEWMKGFGFSACLRSIFLFLSHNLSCVRLWQVAIARYLILSQFTRWEVWSSIPPIPNPTHLIVPYHTELIFTAWKCCIKTILTLYELAVNLTSKSFWIYLYEICYTKLRRAEIVASNKNGISSILCVFGATAQRGSWPPHSRGFYITQNDAPQSVGHLWTSDQLACETPSWQHTTFTTDRPGGTLQHSHPPTTV
jgi:hypothetical protein